MTLELSFHFIKKLRVSAASKHNSNHIEIELQDNFKAKHRFDLFGLPDEEFKKLIRAYADENTLFASDEGKELLQPSFDAEDIAIIRRAILEAPLEHFSVEQQRKMTKIVGRLTESDGP